MGPNTLLSDHFPISFKGISNVSIDVFRLLFQGIFPNVSSNMPGQIGHDHPFRHSLSPWSVCTHHTYQVVSFSGALSHLVATAFSRRGLHAHGASSEDTLHGANSNMHPNLVKLPIMVVLGFDCVHKI